jgi:tRNA threonylcarbamoyl adenosine modification protein (Sua5/YciO/YrdC/YwlC family)
MKTRIIKINDIAQQQDIIQEAAKIVENGGLVAFPTETVYGIACRVSPDSFDKLDDAKGRTPDKRYTLHIATTDQLKTYIPKLNLRTQKLTEKAWPGPVTIVFDLDENQLKEQAQTLDTAVFKVLYKGGTLGVRCPDNAISYELLSRISVPVVAPSANLTGNTPATNSREVIEQLDGKIDMILDGGESMGCKYNQSSTVIRVNGSKIEILREGVVDSKQIDAMSSIQICFVCTGNTCRSPMAEVFCKKYLTEKLNCDIDELPAFGYKVCSAAMMNAYGNSASPEVIEICRKKGIDATSHKSQTLEAGLVRDSDFLYVMTAMHRKHLLQIWPSAVNKCCLLDANGDVTDPIGAGQRIYNACAKQINDAVERRLCEIMK